MPKYIYQRLDKIIGAAETPTTCKKCGKRTTFADQYALIPIGDQWDDPEYKKTARRCYDCVPSDAISYEAYEAVNGKYEETE